MRLQYLWWLSKRGAAISTSRRSEIEAACRARAPGDAVANTAGENEGGVAPRLETVGVNPCPINSMLRRSPRRRTAWLPVTITPSRIGAAVPLGGAPSAWPLRVSPDRTSARLMQLANIAARFFPFLAADAVAGSGDEVSSWPVPCATALGSQVESGRLAPESDGGGRWGPRQQAILRCFSRWAELHPRSRMRCPPGGRLTDHIQIVVRGRTDGGRCPAILVRSDRLVPPFLLESPAWKPARPDEYTPCVRSTIDVRRSRATSFASCSAGTVRVVAERS
jgi:hypothetical protein